MLPKWYGFRSRSNPEWISGVELLPTTEVADALLAVFGDGGAITRDARPATPADDPVEETQVHDLELPPPLLGRDPQWMARDGGTAVITAGENVLLSHHTIGTTELWVLSDPDVMNNYGLPRRHNWAFMRGLVDHLRAGGPVIIDEVIHGYHRETSLLKMLFQYPFVLATVQGLLCFLLMAMSVSVTCL